MGWLLVTTHNEGIDHQFSGIKKFYHISKKKNCYQAKKYDLGNCKNSVGLKPNAELRKDAKAPSIPKSILSINCLFISTLMKDIVLPIQCL
jgi:hypothetical protein